jgi:uncharacterized protein (TIGR02678 family)
MVLRVPDPAEDDVEPGEVADAAPAGGRVRRAWAPEAGDEVAAVLRRLVLTPWLRAGRDDDAMAAVRRNETAVRDALGRLGWVLIVERGLVRLRKGPPVRPQAWASTGPTPSTCSWFFLLVAAAESVPPRCGLAQLVTGARAAAAEACLPVTSDITERRAILGALKLLGERGVVEAMDGDLEGFVRDEDAPVLLAVHHNRLAHVVANPGPVNPADDPQTWLAQVQREPDPARRMRRRLVEDTVVHAVDLDEAEANWLSRRARGDDGGPLAAMFGLHLERRAEGAAFVVPDDAFRQPRELGPIPFPAQGTVPHAALLLCEHAATQGTSEDGPGPGWRGLTQKDVVAAVSRFAAANAAGRGGWSRELADDPDLLAGKVFDLLAGLDLVRRTGVEPDAGSVVDERPWWFAPATGRWSVVADGTIPLSRPAARRKADVDERAEPDLLSLLDGDLTDDQA